MGNLAQHFQCWLSVPTIIKGLVQTCKQGQTKDDNCGASQHGFLCR